MTKQEAYQQLSAELPLLIGPGGKYSADLIGKMAIFCAAFKLKFPDIVFAGFYIARGSTLHIGPYQGAVIACSPIQFGMGVCGRAAEKKETLIVSDVAEFPGYIACDSETRSEIVVPVIKAEKLIAVFDVDSTDPDYFEETDQSNLEQLLTLVFKND